MCIHDGLLACIPACATAGEIWGARASLPLVNFERFLGFVPQTAVCTGWTQPLAIDKSALRCGHRRLGLNDSRDPK